MTTRTRQEGSRSIRKIPLYGRYVQCIEVPVIDWLIYFGSSRAQFAHVRSVKGQCLVSCCSPALVGGDVDDPDGVDREQGPPISNKSLITVTHLSVGEDLLILWNTWELRQHFPEGRCHSEPCVRGYVRWRRRCPRP